jgi:hypothetical protein
MNGAPDIGANLSTPERILLFCIAFGTEWEHAGVTGATEIAMLVRGLIDRDAARLVLTPDGRAVLDALPGAGARSSPGVAYRSFGRISRCAPSSRPPGPTGSTRSSMTGTGCRSAARATPCGCSPGAAMTGAVHKQKIAA